MNYGRALAIKTAHRIIRLHYNPMMTELGSDRKFYDDYDINKMHYYEAKGSEISNLKIINNDDNQTFFIPWEKYEIYEYPSKLYPNDNECGTFYILIYYRHKMLFYLGELHVNKKADCNYDASLRLDDIVYLLVDKETKRYTEYGFRIYKGKYKHLPQCVKKKSKNKFDYLHHRRDVYYKRNMFQPKRFNMRFAKDKKN